MCGRAFWLEPLGVCRSVNIRPGQTTKQRLKMLGQLPSWIWLSFSGNHSKVLTDQQLCSAVVWFGMRQSWFARMLHQLCTCDTKRNMHHQICRSIFFPGPVPCCNKTSRWPSHILVGSAQFCGIQVIWFPKLQWKGEMKGPAPSCYLRFQDWNLTMW